jgi:glycosyltransferase involved in cell wall biosynthesis
MMTFAHLIEPVGLGGVVRNLETLTEHMRDVTHIRHDVEPRTSLPPVIPADQLVVIHFTASWSKMPYLAALRAMRGRAPIVIVEHSYTGSYEHTCVRSRAKFRTMLRLIYSFADRVVAVSHGQGRWLRESGVVAPEKVVVIPSSTYCGELEKLAPPMRTGANGHPLRIAAYGRYCEQKGFGNLIQAMRGLPAGMATLTLAGFGSYDTRLRALAACLPNVTVGGPTQDVAGLLAGCDVVAMPSLFESFGQVALEGRAAARPLIACAVDGLVEQTSPEWGWLAEPDDIFGLSQAIRAAAGANINVMGLAARCSVAGHLEGSMDRWRELAGTLMAQGGRAAARRKAA